MSKWLGPLPRNTRTVKEALMQCQRSSGLPMSDMELVRLVPLATKPTSASSPTSASASGVDEDTSSALLPTLRDNETIGCRLRRSDVSVQLLFEENQQMKVKCAKASEALEAVTKQVEETRQALQQSREETAAVQLKYTKATDMIAQLQLYQECLSPFAHVMGIMN